MKKVLPPILIIIAGLLWWIISSHSTKGQAPGQILYPAYQTNFDTQTDLLKQILIELKGMRNDMAAFAPGSAVNRVDGLALIKGRCARCHSDEAESGGKFQIFHNGTLAALSGNDRRKMIEMVSEGKMPLNKPLPQNERKVIVDFISKGVSK